MASESRYDAFLLVSFGGPEGPDDVLPFLENVVRGRNVPRERLLEVAEHYQRFGGASPINAQNRALIEAIRREFADAGIALPVYWGNRNWHPTLPEALRQMQQDGVRRALAFFTSTFSCYSGCRQYRENLADARKEVGPGAPAVERLRLPFNHPGFLEPMAENVRRALARLPADRRAAARLLFTAHSIPLAMAERSQYEAQLREASRLVAERSGGEDWELVYQSRSGPPHQPWLEPDVCDAIRRIHETRAGGAVVIAPIGFVSDHMEVVYDLDHEAAEVCRSLGIAMRRAATVGTHPRYVRMIRELVVERTDPAAPRLALGTMAPNPDFCPADCCTYARGPERVASEVVGGG